MKIKRTLSIILTAVFLLFTVLGSCPAKATTTSTSRAIKGIDVSSYQEDIDFTKVADAKIKIVYIRACMGSDETDTDFASNYKKAKAAGLKIGFYQYVTATTESEAYDQARYFYSLIKDKTYECRLAMDFEDFGSLTDSEINKIATTYLQTLAQLTGYKPLLYSDENRVANLWESSLSEYPLWIADYSVSSPSDLGHWSKWAGFQYSDSGTVDGISDDVDLDYFRTTVYKDTTTTEVKNTVTVKSDDTLTKLAKRYSTSVTKLVKENLLTNKDLILIGQKLTLPDDSTRHLKYTIKHKDTLWALSRSFHTTVKTLTKLNDLDDPDFIRTGDTLLIPVHE